MTRQRSLIVLVGALLCAGNLLGAQRTFVSAANGNDANACSRSLPCRSFAAALLVTDPDGEVIVLDSGGYGVITITQSVSLISPAGVHAGITALSGNAVTVNAGDTAHVVLRNLSLGSQGAMNGIDAATVAALYIENCVVSGFSLDGIRFGPTTTGARLYVSDTTVRRSGEAGILLSGGTGLRATIDSVSLHENFRGVLVFSAEVMVRESVAGGGGFPGFYGSSGSKIIIQDSVSTGNLYGFYASSGGMMTLVRCAASSNGSGVVGTGTDTKIYVSDSTIASNDSGVSASSGAAVISRGNNTLQGNTADGSFSGTFPPN